MSKIAVIGGGAAGMMAATTAADAGHDVTLYEKNDKLGKKIFITGKGRCNVTNACEVEDLIEAMIHNSKFMYSSFYTWTNEQTVAFFNDHGVATKIERGNRVFPVSDKSSDIIRVLRDACVKSGVTLAMNSDVEKLIHQGDRVIGIRVNNQDIMCDHVVVATGGLSYAMTGSTGDGYRFAKQVGHKIIKCEPGLVPFNVKEQWVKDLQGLSLKNVAFTIESKGKAIYNKFGEMMFTHFGVTGPLVLTAASMVSEKNMPLKGYIDLKPALSEQQLDLRLQKDFDKFSRKDFANSLVDLLPKKMIPVIIKLSGIEPHKKVDQITKEERKILGDLLKRLPLTVISKRGYNEAIITQGGIDVKSIDPNTMASKKVKGLYFVGEVLDIDGVTGGFNLQVAFSTGYLAGISMD